ncbi:MAG: DNA helicase RecQ [Phycisphaeraceae bacterium]
MPTQSDDLPSRIKETIRHFWGFDTLRPLQQEAIEASLASRDSLVVMPTGGGKSLCYQVPPAVAERTDVVISPLISLMKDQVDGLIARGYPAAALHSNLSPAERRDIERGMREHEYRLIFAAPERALSSWFLNSMQAMNVQSIAIDEAHCISQWGHDFRPEYRQLAMLRDRFTKANFHAFTATATPRVQQDIVDQLRLRNPARLIGRFDRPNLIYRILPKVGKIEQIVEALRRHEKEAAIIYCISRRDTEELANVLRANGFNAAHYHGKMDANSRRKTQEAFSNEQLDVVVATVAFGMGIDRSNVRCVIHESMPKTIEHYQQETGRAGRDGLEAECVMLYSAGDAMRWESLIEKSAENAENPREVIEASRELIDAVSSLCRRPVCRHKSLSEYFGQTYDKPNCGACDVCLEDVEGYDDATVAAQKILSCVARVQQRFGIGHVVDVLLGANTENIRRNNHQELSTYGLMKDTPREQLQSMVYQLVDQGLLVRTPGDRPTLQLNDQSWAVMKGQIDVKLLRPKQKKASRSKAGEQSWEGVDKELFEELRKWRKGVADERRVPPYVIMEDSTLMELASVRPTTLDVLRAVRGIGDKRMTDFGAAITRLIDAWCERHHISTNERGETSVVIPVSKRPSEARQRAFDLFAKQQPLEHVAAKISRAPSTTAQYLIEWIHQAQPKAVDPWVDPETYKQVLAAMSEDGRLKPVFEKLGGAVPYETIRIVIAHQRAHAGLPPE